MKKGINMNRLYFLSIILITFVIGSPSFGIAGETDEYMSAIQLFRESEAVNRFFENSYGYAVFPTIGKAGLFVGGSYGTGRVYRDGEVTGTVSVMEGSIGLQFGGKAFSEIIFLEDKRAYDEFISGVLEFDATIQAVAITAGAEARAGTSGSSAGASAGPNTGVQAETEYYKGMAVFIHSKGGLMYEVSVSGQKFVFSPLEN